MSQLEQIRSVLQRVPASGYSRPTPNELETLEGERNCAHAASELRVKTNAAGGQMYGRQCLRCGCADGPWLKKQDALAFAHGQPLPVWDNDAPQRFWKDISRRQTDLREQHRQEQSDAWWEAYDAYLKTREWAEKRRLVLERAGGLCEGCRQRRAVQVHHTSYEHVGDELLWELRAVCRECHDRIHIAGAA